MNRRDFLRASAAAGGGLLLAIAIPRRGFGGGATAGAPIPFVPNAYLRIDQDGNVTVLIPRSEMGQGIATSIPMLVAEELEADWSRVRFEFAPTDLAKYGMQLTGGSTSIRRQANALRKAGAAAREMLIAAASKSWRVAASTCRAENGVVFHDRSKRQLSYGALASLAAAIPVPADPPLKQSGFKLIGKKVARLDTPAKVDGSAVFGLDVNLPGMLVARVLRCPVLGGKLGKHDATAAEKIAGVKRVVAISSGVGVIADGYWAATKGLRALEVTWEIGDAEKKRSTQAIRAEAKKLAESDGVEARRDGDVAQARAEAAKSIDAVYEAPFLSHSPMEPMNFTADVRADGCDLWGPTQAQTWAQQAAAGALGLEPEKVRVHTTFLGGGFGRRSEQDFVLEAVELSKAAGAPVKVIWSREDDTQHGFYRPATYNVLGASIDAKGALVAWRHRIVGPSILARVFPMAMIGGGPDPTSIEGAANIPYDVPNVFVDWVRHDTGVPVGFWRSVGSSQNAYVTESFFDEVARLAGRDPLEYRLALLGKSPRHKKVLELAADKAGWGKTLPEGRFRGLAVAESFGTIVAHVAELSIEPSIRVHRVVCAVDCGTIVNPDTVEAQMQSGIIYALSAALKGEITIDGGRVVQRNFNDYQMVRMHEAPVIEVHLAPSGDAMGGVGEPGVPPLAPAVANAVYAATGKPVRSLPVRP